MKEKIKSLVTDKWSFGKGFEKIGIPKFIFEDGTQGVFVGVLRSYESNIDTNKDQIRFFDNRGHYYAITFDNRACKKLKKPTFIIESKYYFNKIVGMHTMGCKVNPDNGHLLVPHDCNDKSCRAKVILFGRSS